MSRRMTKPTKWPVRLAKTQITWASDQTDQSWAVRMTKPYAQADLYLGAHVFVVFCHTAAQMKSVA